MLTMFENYKLHHVGILAPTFEDAQSFMHLMGLREAYRGYVETWSCWCIFTAGGNGTAIELVVPLAGQLLKFNKGLGGVHHFAFQVDSLAAVTLWANEQGMRMLEPAPVKGAGDFWCNFLTPASTRGVQIEFVEPF